MADTPSKVPARPGGLQPFGGFGGDIDQLFNRLWRGWPFGAWPEAPAGSEPRALRAFEHAPKAEVKENDKAYVVTLELPGLDDKDVKVTVEDDVLTIAGEKKFERTDEKTHYTERSYGSFARSFQLPSDADQGGISASFAKGLLTLDIPKLAQPQPKGRQIDVKTG